jgi:hypothetical protein
MEEIINTFNTVIDQYAEEYSLAETKEEQDAVHTKYETIINDAEALMEQEIEAFIQKEDAALLAEQKASEDELAQLEKDSEAELKKFLKEKEDQDKEEEKEEEKVLEEKEEEKVEVAALQRASVTISPIDAEIELIKELSEDDISKRYNKTNNKKNGFSTTEIYEYLAGDDTSITEAKMAAYIKSQI